jgi:hypothetical protein
MVGIGTRINVRLAGAGTVEGFYFGRGHRRNLLVGAYVRTATGTYPVRLARGTQALVNGETRTVVI